MNAVEVNPNVVGCSGCWDKLPNWAKRVAGPLSPKEWDADSLTGELLEAPGGYWPKLDCNRKNHGTALSGATAGWPTSTTGARWSVLQVHAPQYPN